MSDKMDEDKADEFLPGLGSFGTFSQSFLASVIQATRCSQSLPKDADFGYHRTETAFRSRMKSIGDSILARAALLLARENPQAMAAWEAQDTDVDDRLQAITEANDIMLERVDAALDEIKGVLKPAASLQTATKETSLVSRGSWNAASASASASGQPNKKIRLMHATNIRRPQLDFKEKVDNSASEPFRPRIKSKPNAIAPLALEKAEETLPATDTTPATKVTYYENPYKAELLAFEAQVGPVGAEQMFAPLAATPCTWVDNTDELAKMADKLKHVTEFAIDLEAHNYRTYQGFSCLMQVSTRTEDFLVDVLELRAELHVLNESFTDPRIVKVLHGSDSDILWLQRDFGLYIVNLFDTGQAMRILNFPRFSLAYLLKFYCDIEVDKSYQLADWRVRPLSAAMLHYAREDTHYLLYVYDRLRTELVNQGNDQFNLLHAVYTRSRDLCLQRYEKPTYSQEQAVEMFQKHNRVLTPVQYRTFLLLHQWRDTLAREEDESPRYVLPDHMLFELATMAPREHTHVLACCQPTPPLVRIHAHTIVDIINTAKHAPDAQLPERMDTSDRRTSGVGLQQQQGQGMSGYSGSALPSSYRPPSPLLSIGELFDYAQWVAKPEEASKLAQVLVDEDQEDIIEAEKAQKAAQIHASFATACIFTRPINKDGAFEPPAAVPAASEVKAKAIASAVVVPEAQGQEPSTYEEIYQLSNLNRKKNKEKKKSKDDTSPSPTPQDADEGEAPATFAAEDTEEFMSKINWTKPGDKPKTLEPFDYKANGASAFTERSKSEGGTFNPYGTKTDERPHPAPRGGNKSSREGGNRSVTGKFNRSGTN